MELIVDNFAGGGGASCGIEQALGRPVDVAINHDRIAVALHKANHPRTRHWCEDIWAVEPEEVTQGQGIGLAWFSPDCKHFSKAKGGKPRSKKIRGLAWVVIKWAVRVKPRVIVLENVEEFEDWGPLRADGMPCPERKGRTFKSFVKRLRGLGYEVDWRPLRACDYGAPTIRKRLYMVARCDGRPIVWPAPTHSEEGAGGLERWRTAAECIDWGLACPSIFLTKREGRRIGVKRPLARATMRRLARGMFKYVIEAKEPFIVPLTHQGSDRVEGVCEPFRTITGAHRGEKALAVPYLTEHANSSTQRNFAAKDPLRTQCAEVKGGHFALVSAFLAKWRFDCAGASAQAPMPTITAGSFVKRPGGAGHALGLVAGSLVRHFGESVGGAVDEPLPTVMPGGRGKTGLVAANLMVNTSGHSGGAVSRPMPTIPTGGHHALAAAHLTKFYGTNVGNRPDEPLRSVTAEGNHIGEVRAFLIKYYGAGTGQDVREPLHTIPTLDRFGLVRVKGEDFQIVDIGMRMLAPRELFRGQGFPESYVIQMEVEAVRNGKVKRVRLSGDAQVRLCGNSVCPPVAAAIVGANVPELKGKGTP